MAAAIRFSIEIKADPALIDAVHALANALGVALPALGVTAPTPEQPVKPEPAPKPPPKSAHIAPAPGQEPPPPAPVVEEPPAPPPIAPPPKAIPEGLVRAREAAKALALRDRPALVALLKRFGADSLANLAPAHYEAFVAEAGK